MRIELKRNLYNGAALITILANLLHVLFGLILLLTIDYVKIVTFPLLSDSVYMVYTQFGPLIFSPIVLSIFYLDYKEKNIIFYQSQGYNAVQYYIFKIMSIYTYIVVGVFISTLLGCLSYAKFNMILPLFLKISMVMLYFTMISSVIGYLVSSFVVAFFINVGFWICDIVIASLGSWFQYFAYYDASTSNRQHFLNILMSKESLIPFRQLLLNDIVFNLVIFGLIMIIVFVCRKRWIKNGI